LARKELKGEKEMKKSDIKKIKKRQQEDIAKASGESSQARHVCNKWAWYVNTAAGLDEGKAMKRARIVNSWTYLHERDAMVSAACLFQAQDLDTWPESHLSWL
jgi:hypothetical protein